MTTETAPLPVYFKYGRGIDITMEALVEVLRERFPDAADWDYMSNHIPSIQYDIEREVLSLRWAWIAKETDFPSDVVLQHVRRVGEGAPIPTSYISMRTLLDNEGE